MFKSIRVRLIGAAAIVSAATLALILVKLAPTTAANTSVQVAPVVAAVAMLAPPTYVEADSKHSSSYLGYEVTEYRPTKHLITAIGTGGERDRTILVETDGQTWVELDVSTENNKGTFRFEMVDESTAEFTVNGVLTSRAMPDETDLWVAICIDDAQVQVSAEALEVMMDVAGDANLNVEVEVLGPFATMGVPCCGGGQQAMASGGLCFRPIWWDAEVKFVNCSGCGICVLPENGSTQDCSPGDGTWIPTDGLVLPGYGPGQWLKIPGNCTVTVTCTNCVPSISCCCNLGAILAWECGLLDECVAQCTLMDCCANPNDPCHQHPAVDCSNCP